MVALSRVLLLNLFLLSHVYANEESANESVKWLEAERSVLVRLATPDLFFWNQRAQIATHSPGAFIFNFTLSPDNRVLYLNDEPILPRAHPYIPTPLRAYQTGESASEFAQRGRPNLTDAPLMDLDYYIATPDTTSGTSIYNTQYNPRLQIDILRASIPALPGYSAPLASNSQDQIWVWLEDLSAHPPDTLYSSIALRITRVQVSRRWPDADSRGTTTYKALRGLKTCHIWSWLCADIDPYPYYQYIYRENFDQYGKKGSMRHFATARWGYLVGVVGVGQAVVRLVVCGGVVLWPVVHAVVSGVTRVVEVNRKRIQEVDEWVADEEIEGLLVDSSLVGFGVVEKEELAEVEGGEKSTAEESLPDLPPSIPMKMEKSSTEKEINLVNS